MADARKSTGKSGRGKKPPTDAPRPTDAADRLSVLVELRGGQGASQAHAMNVAATIEAPGFEIDHKFTPVPMGGAGEGMAPGTETYLVRGTVADEAEMAELRARPDVVDVILDTPIAPFSAFDPHPDVEVNEGAAACAIPPCDCSPGTPKGNMADVAAYLKVDQIWARGLRGTGIVVGVLDSGITAQGRPVKSGETSRRIPRVIGGWPTGDWGTESSKWGDHGNMCATDVLGMAPDAQLYDLRIAGAGGSPGTISRALQAFQWAIDRHRTDGTPHVLTNSWGIFQETWDATYARNANHPFTRKVVEAVNEGILVLFAAGNCGAGCPDGRCGPDNGPGRSIWGANSHPAVMTVGAVNKNEQYVGYSSQGPGALDPNKPDFCSVTHFTGYHNSDSGTSAATPILAGVVALLKQAAPGATQDGVKQCLRSTAKDIGPAGFDQHSGAGIVQPLNALNCLVPVVLNTLRPPCQPFVTRNPPCQFVTQGPPCVPRTVGPPCFQVTRTPACRPTVNPANCPVPVTATCPVPVTRSPGCLVTRTPACRPTLANCPVPVTRNPGCVPVTVGPGCGFVTQQGCPRPTMKCPEVTMGCPGPGPGLEYGDPYGYGQDPYGSGADPYGSGQDPYGSGADPYGYGQDPYGSGADPYGYGQNPYGSGPPAGYGPAPAYAPPTSAATCGCGCGGGTTAGDEYGYPAPGEYGSGDPYAG